MIYEYNLLFKINFIPNSQIFTDIIILKSLKQNNIEIK